MKYILAFIITLLLWYAGGWFIMQQIDWPTASSTDGRILALSVLVLGLIGSLGFVYLGAGEIKLPKNGADYD